MVRPIPELVSSQLDKTFPSSCARAAYNSRSLLTTCAGGGVTVYCVGVARRLDLNLTNDVSEFINGTPIVRPMNPMPVDTNLTMGPSPVRGPSVDLRPRGMCSPSPTMSIPLVCQVGLSVFGPT